MDILFISSAGEVGIEPTNGGFKGPCLTTWLLPKNQLTMNREQKTNDSVICS